MQKLTLTAINIDTVQVQLMYLYFREAVYGWNALEDRYEIAKHLETFNRDIDLNNYQPLSSIAHLQYLFGEMQFGLTKYCDPEAFCRSLSIDVELQQDAQVSIIH